MKVVFYIVAILIVMIFQLVIKGKKKQLMIPYTLDNNDMKFLTNQGFNW